MTPPIESDGRNYARRMMGVLICTLPITVPAASVIAGRFYQRPPLVGLGFISAALLIASINFCLSFMRPAFVRRFRSAADYCQVSGIPLIGTLLILVGSLYGFGASGTAVLGAITALIDTGGLPWFLAATWRDASFWDA
jgi:hypothetical protein